MGIEEFLKLSKEEITRRVDEERRKIPTIPGSGYLEQRLARFKTPEWEFLSYLAHYNPATLERTLEQYACYDGNEAREAVLEGLREQYIFYRLKSKLEEEKPAGN